MVLLAEKEHTMADFVGRTCLMLTHAPKRRTGEMVMVMMMMIMLMVLMLLLLLQVMMMNKVMMIMCGAQLSMLSKAATAALKHVRVRSSAANAAHIFPILPAQ